MCCSPWGHSVRHNLVTEQQPGIGNRGRLGPLVPVIQGDQKSYFILGSIHPPIQWVVTEHRPIPTV